MFLCASIGTTAAATFVVACSNDDDDMAGASPDATPLGDAAARDAAAGDVADATTCPSGQIPAYAEPGCVAFTDSIVTPSTTKLELKTLDTEDGGCGYLADIDFDVTGQTATMTTCAAASDGGQSAESTSLSLTPAQASTMLADWTNIRRASVDGGTISCGWSLLEYPAAVTRTDSSGVTTIDTCAGSPSYIYDDSAAFQSLLTFFAADGGS